MAADCDPKAWAGALVAVAQAGASLTEVDGPLELASAGSAAVWLSPADAGYLAVRVAGGGRRARLGCADVACVLSSRTEQKEHWELSRVRTRRAHRF